MIAWNRLTTTLSCWYETNWLCELLKNYREQKNGNVDFKKTRKFSNSIFRVINWRLYGISIHRCVVFKWILNQLTFTWIGCVLITRNVSVLIPWSDLTVLRLAIHVITSYYSSELIHAIMMRLIHDYRMVKQEKMFFYFIKIIYYLLTVSTVVLKHHCWSNRIDFILYREV